MRKLSSKRILGESKIWDEIKMQSRKKWDLMLWIILFRKYEKSPEAAIFSLWLLSRNFALIIFKYIYIYFFSKETILFFFLSS